MSYAAFLVLACSYLIGSLPIGYLFSRLWFGQDIRLHGSGNIGATNVARLFGGIFFVPILCLDACKAYIAVLLGNSVSPTIGLLCGLCCLVGNIFSLFLGGLGGKGVATILGIVGAISPITATGFATIWLSAVSMLSRAGIASVIALLALAPLGYYFDCTGPQCLLFVILSTVSIVRHRCNIVSFISA